MFTNVDLLILLNWISSASLVLIHRHVYIPISIFPTFHNNSHFISIHVFFSLSLFLGGVSNQRRSRYERATRSLAAFVCSHRSLRSLASLRSLHSLAPFTGSLTHFAHSLVGRLKFLNMCSRCYRVSWEQTRFWRSLETRP